MKEKVIAVVRFESPCAMKALMDEVDQLKKVISRLQKMSGTWRKLYIKMQLKNQVLESRIRNDDRSFAKIAEYVPIPCDDCGFDSGASRGIDCTIEVTSCLCVECAKRAKEEADDYDGKYAPSGSESGTYFSYKSLAKLGCVRCGGFGEWHVPYEDYSTYIIHRCDCTR